LRRDRRRSKHSLKLHSSFAKSPSIGRELRKPASVEKFPAGFVGSAGAPVSAPHTPVTMQITETTDERKSPETRAMKCLFCGFVNDKVVDSRESKEADSIRRRRECLKCEKRFTTYERIDE